MFKNERHQSILSILKEKDSVSVEYLAKTLYVSASTVRRDLRVLEAEGFLRYHYGNVCLVDESSKALPIELRKNEMRSAKWQIGKKAAELVSNGDVLFIDASSTCLHLIERLGSFENLTVITSGLQALELLKTMNITTYCTGGKLLRNSMAFVGNLAENAIEQFHVDKYFFSVSSLSEDGVLSDGGEHENRIHRLMLQQSCQKICLLDSSKIGTRSIFRAGTISQLDYIVSDTNIYDRLQQPGNDKAKLLLVSNP